MDRYILIVAFVMLVVSTTAAQLTSASHSRAAASGHNNSPSTNGAVARVNGTLLTELDLRREMSAMFPYTQQHGGKVPHTMEADIRRGALQMIEFEELVYQETLRRKMHISPARLDRAMTEFQAQFDSQSAFQNVLKAEFRGSSAVLRQRIQRSLLIDELLDLEVTKKSEISPSEVRSAYDRDPARFSVPRKVSIQTISIVLPDDATPEQEHTARSRAEDVLRQAKATKNSEEFGVLAEKVSDDEWRVMMGDHGSIEAEKMPPQVAQVVFHMSVGEVSDLVRAENSYCIVRLNGSEPARHLPFEQVREQLRKSLQAKRVEQLRGTLNRRLRQSAKVEEFS